jgi:hypothetical protein
VAAKAVKHRSGSTHAEASKIPYSPNRGVTIADFTPQQKAAMANTSAAADAFGLASGDSPAMPAAETSATGIKGFSTGAEFDDMVSKSLSPALQAAINKFFLDRGTGKMEGAAASNTASTGQSTMKKIFGQTFKADPDVALAGK